MRYLPATLVLISATLGLFACSCSGHERLSQQPQREDGQGSEISTVSPSDVAAGALDKLSRGLDEQFRSLDIVRAVNALRRVGKKSSLILLNEALKREEPDAPMAVSIVCRLLFRPPSGGWTHPVLGAPFPSINPVAAGGFPLFPIAISHGVPFILVRGYTLVGVTTEPEQTLSQCQTSDLVARDLPLDGYSAAAKALVSTDQFKQLYPNSDDIALMARDVITQSSR